MKKEKALTPLRRKFVALYLKTGNATQAYLDAGFAASARQIASVEAHKLLRISIVQREVAAQSQAVVDKLGDDTIQIIKTWVEIAGFDAREHSEVRRVPCRHCYGIDHKY